MENDLCKSGGLPLQFIMITTNDDEDDWDDDNDSEESFNDTLIPLLFIFFLEVCWHSRGYCQLMQKYGIYISRKF